MSVAEPSKSFNLFELQNGITALVGEAELPAGRYKAVQVVIDVSQSSVTLYNGFVADSFEFVPWIRAVNEAATGTPVGTVRGRDGALVPVPDASISVYPSTYAVFNGSNRADG